jgi:hypothetical protein
MNNLSDPQEKKRPASLYTCNEYREEMILLALMQRLNDPGLAGQERLRIEEEIRRLEKSIGL